MNSFDALQVDKGHIIHQGWVFIFLCAERTELVIQLFMQISSYSASLEGKWRIYSIQESLCLSLPLFLIVLMWLEDFYDSIL